MRSHKVYETSTTKASSPTSNSVGHFSQAIRGGAANPALARAVTNAGLLCYDIFIELNRGVR